MIKTIQYKKFISEMPDREMASILDTNNFLAYIRNPIGLYKYLRDNKDKIPRKVFVFCVRELIVTSGDRLPYDYKVEFLKDIKPSEFMELMEYLYLKLFVRKKITLYRGCDIKETLDNHGIHWTRDFNIAMMSSMRSNHGHVLTKTFDKSDIYAHLISGSNETEFLILRKE